MNGAWERPPEYDDPPEEDMENDAVSILREIADGLEIERAEAQAMYDVLKRIAQSRKYLTGEGNPDLFWDAIKDAEVMVTARDN